MVFPRHLTAAPKTDIWEPLPQVLVLHPRGTHQTASRRPSSAAAGTNTDHSKAATEVFCEPFLKWLRRHGLRRHTFCSCLSYANQLWFLWSFVAAQRGVAKKIPLDWKVWPVPCDWRYQREKRRRHISSCAHRWICTLGWPLNLLYCSAVSTLR